MEFMTLGQSDIQASAIGLGTWAIGGWMWGGSDETQCIATIHKAMDVGVTLVDTAPVYGFGRSEEIVGQAIKGKRDKVVLVTKVGLEWNAQEKVVRNASPERLVKEIEDSLRRLQTDHIDLYFVHWPDPLVPCEKTGEALARLKAQGKIKAIGVSNYNCQQIEATAKAVPLDAVQSPYNLFERDIEKDVLAYAHKHNMAVLSYGAICRGLLSGKHRVTTDFKGDDLRKNDPKFKAPRFDQYLKAVDALDAFAQKDYGKSVLDLAVRWVIDKGTIALWGARKPEQVAGFKGALGWHLNADAMAQIDHILAEHIKDPVGPEFMAPPARQAQA